MADKEFKKVRIEWTAGKGGDRVKHFAVWGVKNNEAPWRPLTTVAATQNHAILDNTILRKIPNFNPGDNMDISIKAVGVHGLENDSEQKPTKTEEITF